jgi:hypothetical protein
MLFGACPEPIGDRCGDGLPPCPGATACVAGRCTLQPDGGGSGGNATGGGGTAGGNATGGGGTAGGNATGGGGTAGGAPSDAGTDAGAVTDAGADAGAPRDAGRVLTVIDRLLFVQTDGGTEEHPNTGEVVNALFALADGGLQRLAMTTDGGGLFVVENAPAGPWMIEAIPPNNFRTYYDVSGDQHDITSRTQLGRPGVPVTRQDFIFLDLTVQPWGEPGTHHLQLSSRSAGSRFHIYPEPAPGTVLLYGQYPSDSVHGPAIRPSDDLRVSQFGTSFRDGGAASLEIVGSVLLTGATVPGQFVSGTLVPPNGVGTARVRLDAGALEPLVGGPVSSCDVRLEEVAGDARLLNPPEVFSIGFSHMSFDTYEFAVPHPSGHPVSSWVMCTRLTSSQVPTADGGFEASDAGVLRAGLNAFLHAVDRLSLDGGTATQPSAGVPRNIRVDGLGTPGLVSATPTVSWEAPMTGDATFYEVFVRRVTRTANTFVRSAIAFVYTTQTQVQIPAGVLVPGERYAFQISAFRLASPDPRRPWKQLMPMSSGVAHSPIVYAR